MTDVLKVLISSLEQWTEEAIASGWLPTGSLQQIDSRHGDTPGTLFDNTERPLVAGLFGGTGVGKSSLLNRLARDTVAQTSAVRPTSRDITVYVHKSITVDHLPDDFPMARMRTSLHQNDAYRNVLWIDMPDFDSVESSHRELVDLWLPHLDVVIYVVSPERYRDDQGWRLMSQHASQHAWLFVMNHWDKGDEIQFDDFQQQLIAAGLEDPLIFKTDCSNPDASASLRADATPHDDFALLESTLGELAESSMIKALEARGIVQRLQLIRGSADTLVEKLGDKNVVGNLPKHWESAWKQNEDSLHTAMTWQAEPLAEAYVNNPSRALSTSITDNTLMTRLDTTVETFINATAEKSGLPVHAAHKHLDPAIHGLKQQLPQFIDDAVARSLLAPGTRLQRIAYKVLTILAVVLPVAALGWISYRVVNAFVEGGSDVGAYLGTSFAINSIFLAGLAWFLPTFLARKLKPSRAQAVARGIKDGARIALDRIDAEVTHSLTALTNEHTELHSNYAALWNTDTSQHDSALPVAVKRMLVDKISQSAGVRATTHSSTDAAPVS